MDSGAPIGNIGLGLMGTALSRRLIDARIPVLGFDIDPARCETLAANGGMVANSVPDLAGRCRAILLALHDSEQVEAVLGELGSESSQVRRTVICTTTCTPDDIIRIAGRAAGAGLPFVEAPISGGSDEVSGGTATV